MSNSKFPIPGRGPRPVEASQAPAKYDDGFVGRITVGLTHQEFYLEVPGYHPTQLGLLFLKVYSVLREQSNTHQPGKLLGVLKHQNVHFIAMGLVIEEVPTPSWWEDRDKGLL
jgi:hypothetical protein